MRNWNVHPCHPFFQWAFRTAIFIAMLSAVRSVPAHAGTLVLTNGFPLSFTGTNTALIQKGDHFDYTNNLFNDRNWRTMAIPSSWEPEVYPGYTGICWLRFHVVFPQNLPMRSLGLILGTVSRADETYFNGHLIGNTGDFQDSLINRSEQVRIYEIPAQWILSGRDNVLAIRVKGYIPGECGPTAGQYGIDGFNGLVWNLLKVEILKLLLVAFYVTIGAFFLVYFSRRMKNLEYLFFGLFCIVFASYYFLQNQFSYYAILPYEQITYAVLYLQFPLFMSFILVYFQKKHHPVHLAFYVSTLACIVTIAATNDPVAWKWLNNNIAQWTWLVPIGTSFWVLFGKLKKDRDARLMFTASIILVLFIIHDILFDRGIIQDSWSQMYGFWSQYILIVFISFTAYILADKFVWLQKKVEILNRDLQDNYRKITDINADLENKVRERTAELEMLNRRLEISARTDMLTGLNNRKEMETRLQEEILRSYRYRKKPPEYLSLLFLDLDHFKYYNDHFGHAVGDMILQDFAKILGQNVRNSDFVSRFGGDEFIIIMNSANETEAGKLALRIREQLTDKNNFIGEIRNYLGFDVEISPEYQLSCSIGISYYIPGMDINYDKLIKQADKALYAAKNRGRNTTVTWTADLTEHTA